jgi:hypothetical protein
MMLALLMVKMMAMLLSVTAVVVIVMVMVMVVLLMTKLVVMRWRQKGMRMSQRAYVWQIMMMVVHTPLPWWSWRQTWIM